MTKINVYSILVGRPEGKNHFENLDVNRKIILERILGKYGRKLWTGFIWLTIGTIGGPL
jgi:hypothetical protein